MKRVRPFGRAWPETPRRHVVAVLGASPKPERYSNQALRQLKSQGYRVIPVHPKVSEIEHLTVVHSLRRIDEPVHTLTVYIGPKHSAALIDDIVALNPGRVILNPGTESTELEERLRGHHIPCLHACTLVLLHTGQF